VPKAARDLDLVAILDVSKNRQLRQASRPYCDVSAVDAIPETTNQNQLQQYWLFALLLLLLLLPLLPSSWS
jgi:hypothetical protein